MLESIGKRIALLRQMNGWTQQYLADRLAMSRVAISHIEMDLTIPSERSITLMAGVFKLPPIQLVEGTTYPRAKMERLPEITTTHTDLELNYALLKNDLEWLERLSQHWEKLKWIQLITEKWYPLLEDCENCFSGEYETKILIKMRQLLIDLNDERNHGNT
jgi:transcriptional regulator with XRE-family HTH domain